VIGQRKQRLGEYDEIFGRLLDLPPPISGGELLKEVYPEAKLQYRRSIESI
jgi:hypothetical protein